MLNLLCVQFKWLPSSENNDLKLPYEGLISII